VLKNLKFYIEKYSIPLTLSLAILLGVILRLYGLTFQSYWFDELFSVKLSNPIHSLSYVYDHTMGDVHPPFYQSLLWLWYQIFGFSEYSGRVLSALAGIFSIYAIYALAKELYNREVGLYSAFIVATNYFAILYSQEVRSNIFMLLFSILSYLYFIRVTKDNSKLNLFLYLLFSLLLMYTHYFGFFLVATQLFVFLYYIIEDRDTRAKLFKLALIAGGLMFVALLPLFQRILEHIHTSSYWMPSPSPLFFIDYMKAYVLSPFLYKIFLALLLMSIISIFIKKIEYKKSTITLLLWAIFAYLLPYLKSITGFSILIDRSTIIVIPALAILVSYGIYLLRINYIKIATLLAIIFFALYHIYRMDYYIKVSKDQFRETLNEIININSSVDVYDFVYSGESFKAQADLNSIDINIYSLKRLKELDRKGNIPKCFWAVHGHKDFISTASILRKEGMVKVYTINKFQAQAFLYAYKTDPKICLKANNE